MEGELQASATVAAARSVLTDGCLGWSGRGVPQTSETTLWVTEGGGGDVPVLGLW